MDIILFSLLCIKYFFFWPYRSVEFKGNIEYTKNVLRQPRNALMLQLSVSLRGKFISPEATVINLFAVLRVFLVGLAN